ncbi:MAG TPA: hypothetical protein VNJ47_03660 [Nevskiales bacterium]|nr:hypothetical protein [Nevskiales bacterium]
MPPIRRLRIAHPARAVRLDGAGLADIGPQLAVLGGMTLLFLGLGAAIFKWTQE